MSMLWLNRVEFQAELHLSFGSPSQMDKGRLRKCGKKPWPKTRKRANKVAATLAAPLVTTTFRYCPWRWDGRVPVCWSTTIKVHFALFDVEAKEGLPRGSAPWESLRTSVLPDLQIQKIPTQCCAVPGYVPRHHFVPFNLTLLALSSVTGLKDLKDTFQSCAEPIYVPRHHFVVPFNWTSLTFICHFQNLYLIL